MIRFFRWRFFLLIVVAGAAASAQVSQTGRRDAAVRRAMAFIHTSAADDATFANHGYDLLWCFYSIAHTSRNSELSRTAWHMGRDLAQRWSSAHRHVPADADADVIANLVMGAYAAQRLGVADPGFKAELRLAAGKFSAKDFLGFDATREPPSLEDPSRYDK